MNHADHSPWHFIAGECWDCTVERLHAEGDPHIKGVPPYVHTMYGPANGGKTYYEVSAMWSAEEQRQLRKGRFMSFGREYNSALGLPVDLQTIGKTLLQFKAPELDSMEWFETLSTVLTAVVKQALVEKNYLDVFAIDGLSELNWMFEQTFRNMHKGDAKRDNFAPFNRWDESFFGLMQKLDPQVLHCPVLMTARVAERRKEVKDTASGKIIMPEDDEEVLGQGEYFPKLRGSFKFWLANYAQIVTYCREVSMVAPSGPYQGQRVSVRKMSLGADGDFLTKFQWEGQWKRAKLPLQLLDPTYDMFMAMLHRALTTTAKPSNVVVSGNKEEVNDVGN